MKRFKLISTTIFAVAVVVWMLVSCGKRPAAAPSSAADGAIRIASFNIHYIAPWQKQLAWDRRKMAVLEAVRELNADIIAFQEMETFNGGSYNVDNKQLDWVLGHFPEYSAGATGHAEVFPNTQPVIYRSAKFEQVDQGFFFFSNTPDVIYSPTFNGSWPAFCSWALIREKRSAKQFYLFNIHFEYKSMSNRGKSAALVVERVKPIVDASKPVVLVGDVNALSFFPTTRKLASIPLSLAPPDGATYHFNRGMNVLPAIDHIFFSDAFVQEGETGRLRRRYNKIWPSDHFPVYVDLNWVEP